MNEPQVGHPLVRLLHRAEDGLLILSLGTMVMAATAQILLRDLFDVTLLWSAPLVRLLVLWGGLAGGLVAVREDRNIRIEIVVRFCPPRCRRGVAAFTGLFSGGVCAFLAWTGGRFVVDEFRYGEATPLGLSSWQAELIFPLAFASMALHFFVGACRSWRE